MAVKHLILGVFSLFFLNLKQCGKEPGEHKITVVGEAIAMKDRVGVKTDDKRRFYLVVKDRHQWQEEYVGKRIEVTGILVPRKDTTRAVVDPDTLVTARQPKLKDGDTIRNARWKVVN